MRSLKYKLWIFIIIICFGTSYESNNINLLGEIFGAEIKDNSFQKWSTHWLNNAGKEIFNPDVLVDGITPAKKKTTEKVFSFLEPLCKEYIQIVSCEPSSFGIVPEVREAMCVNRLLDDRSLDKLPGDLSLTIQELLSETFYLGLFTHLYLMSFPTREQSENVDLFILRQKWQIDAIAADYEMGYYGDPENPILMNIWEFHYRTEVIPILKKNFNPSDFKFGKYKLYFRNLYISGALLVMYYDLSTKDALD